MNSRVRKVVFASALGAVYAALTFILYPVSYGVFQFRVSEVLMILPYFFPIAVPGLFIGCILSNMLSPYGFADVMIGSIATLISAIITMRIGKTKNNEKASIKAIACIPPVIINAVLIGALIASFMVAEGNSETFISAFAVNAVQIGFGQAVVIYLLGLPLMIYLPSVGIIDKLKQIYSHHIGDYKR